MKTCICTKFLKAQLRYSRASNSPASTAAASWCTATTSVMNFLTPAPRIMTQSCQQHLCRTPVKAITAVSASDLRVSEAISGDSGRMTATTGSISTATPAPSTMTQPRQKELRTNIDTRSNRGCLPAASEIAGHQQLHTSEESLQQPVVL